MTESSITLFWRPLNISAVLDISISADGYAERRTFLSSQNYYEIGGLLPGTRYNVSIWLLQPQNRLQQNYPLFIMDLPVHCLWIGGKVTMFTWFKFAWISRLSSLQKPFKWTSLLSEQSWFSDDRHPLHEYLLTLTILQRVKRRLELDIFKPN